MTYIRLRREGEKGCGTCKYNTTDACGEVSDDTHTCEFQKEVKVAGEDKPKWWFFISVLVIIIGWRICN
jgi:hypothetical protein